MTKFQCIILAIIISSPQLMAQQDSSAIPLPQIKGYISEVGSVITWNKQNPVWDNSLQNRLNFSWKPHPWFDVNIQVRNRFLWGETVQNSPAYASEIGADRGLIDLSKNLFSKNQWLLNTQLDRASFHFVKNRFEITLGRQRINWGQTYVWNPNDIFNAYSFFEFDYPERPGSDAIRVQYFNDIAGSFEFALKADSGKKITAAALLKTNKWNYDFQFLAGILNSADLSLGAGWSGNIGGAGFKGEASYFQPLEDFSDTTGMALISLSFDYSFPNSWYLMGEALYRYQGNNSVHTNLLEYLNAPASVKNLAITDINLLAQLSIPVGSLINTSLSAMLLPGVNGFFAGPSISISLSDNLETTASAQLFHGKFPDPYSGIETTQSLGIYFLRLKWNF